MQINHALEVADILRHNLVQGVRPSEDESARWGECLFSLCPYFMRGHRVPECLGLPRTALQEEYVLTWLELRIHEEIERGDNDSIKVGDKMVKVDKPCSA